MTGRVMRSTPGARAAPWIALAAAAGIILGIFAVPAAEHAARGGTARLPALSARRAATLPAVIAHQPVTAMGMSDGGIIGYGTAGGILFLQRPEERRPAMAARVAVSAIQLITFSGNGSTVAGLAGTETTTLWAWATDGTRWSLGGTADRGALSDLAPDPSDPGTVALSPDGLDVAIDSNIGLAALRLPHTAPTTKAEAPVLAMLSLDATGSDGIPQGNPVFAAQSVGVLAATAGITEWSLATGRGVRLFTRCPCESATISEDNTTAVVDELGYVEAWDLRRGVRIGGDLAIPHGARATEIAIAAHDNAVAVGTSAGTVLVWDPYEDRAPTVIKISRMPIYDVALSSDGRKLLVVGSRMVNGGQVPGPASTWTLGNPTDKAAS
jgi:hypothetical protein